MIEQELLILGLLKEKPQHGYDIKKQIKEVLSLFIGLDLKSIYYPLRILEKKGLVVRHINKEGRRPQRFVYKLTPKGEIRFNELLTGSFLNFKRPQFSLDLSLYFFKYIKPDVAKRRLRGRTLILKKLCRDLKEVTNSLRKGRSSSLAHILEHNLRMVETEFQFLQSLIKTL
jgi:DNA-binding PadR family transcriptional regulator